MQLITESDLENARTEIRSVRLDPAEFTFEPRPNPVKSAMQAAGTVIVTRKHWRRGYRAGQGFAWVSEFAGDLQAGLYGRP
jgi:hypothetical protein